MSEPVELSDQVGTWNLTREVIRQSIGAFSRQPRWWTALWGATSMATLVALAALGAPKVAYGVLLVNLVAIYVAGGAECRKVTHRR